MKDIEIKLIKKMIKIIWWVNFRWPWCLKLMADQFNRYLFIFIFLKNFLPFITIFRDRIKKFRKLNKKHLFYDINEHRKLNLVFHSFFPFFHIQKKLSDGV